MSQRIGCSGATAAAGVSKEGTQRSPMATFRDPREKKWGLHKASKAYQIVKMSENKNNCKHETDKKVQLLSLLGEHAVALQATEGYQGNVVLPPTTGLQHV